MTKHVILENSAQEGTETPGPTDSMTGKVRLLRGKCLYSGWGGDGTLFKIFQLRIDICFLRLGDLGIGDTAGS